MPHLKTQRIRRSCNRDASVQIRKEIRSERRKPVSQRRSRSQSVAIGISKVRRKRPRFREVLRRSGHRSGHRVRRTPRIRR